MERWLSELRAQGTVDSSGTFHLDLARAHQLLPRLALVDPGEYVLRLMAAAVEAKASRFSCRQDSRVLTLAWDGHPLEEKDLLGLMPGQSDSELALGLWAARNLYGRVELLGRSHRLVLDQKELTVAPLEQPRDQTGLHLYGPWWKGALARWLPGKEDRLLRQRCRLAPLCLQLQGNDVPVTLDFGERDILIKVGEPTFECDYDVAVPTASGSGYLALGGDIAPDLRSPQLFGQPSQPPTWAGEARPRVGRVLVIRSGVSYEPDWQPSVPMARVLWWSEELPLDLSRSALVEGDALEQWTEEIQQWLENALVEHLLARPQAAGSAYLEWVLEKCRSDPESGLVRRPLFANTDGQRLSIEDLQAEYRRRGYLSVSPASSKRTAPGVLWTEAAPGPELQAHFPHRIRVAEPPRRRLSEKGYVFRVPLPSGAGEMGLRADCLPWLRVFSPDGACTHHHGVPFLDVTSEELPVDPGDLYYCLLQSTGLSPELHLFHSLGFLNWLTHSAGLLGQKDSLLRLLEALPRLSVATSSGAMDPEELWEFIHSLTLPRPGAPALSLVEMARAGGVWYWSSNPEVEHGVHLLLDGLCAAPLTALLSPTTSLAEVHYSVPLTRALKGARNHQQLLQRLCTDPQCAAYRMLGLEARDRLASLSSHGEQSLRSAILEALSRDAMLQTPAILEALREHLEELQKVEFVGLEPPAGASRLHEPFKAYEPRPDTDDPLGICLHHTGRAWFYMRLGRFKEARSQAELAVEACETVDALTALGTTTALDGDLKASLPFYERVLELSPGLSLAWSNWAESLALSGQADEAWRALEKSLSLDPKNPAALALKARMLLESDPAGSWALCEQHTAGGAPVSVWETRALAAERLERPEDARESWRKFLEGAWIETLLENNLPERRARAEAHLARLTTP